MRSVLLLTSTGLVAASLLCACQREATGPEMSRDSDRTDTSTRPAAGTTEPSAQTQARTSNALMLVTSGAEYPYVADPTGRALYYLDGDKDGSRCTGPCTEAWPPYLVENEAAAPSVTGNLQAALLATIRRPDGGTQVTYDQRPLYRYGADAGVGRTAGHGVKDQWGQWHLLAADGSPVPPASDAAPRPEAAAESGPSN